MPTVGFILLLRCPVGAVSERGTWAGGERGSQPGTGVGTRWCRLPFHDDALASAPPHQRLIHCTELALHPAGESGTVCLPSITFAHPQAMLHPHVVFPVQIPQQTLNEHGQTCSQACMSCFLPLLPHGQPRFGQAKPGSTPVPVHLDQGSVAHGEGAAS